MLRRQKGMLQRLAILSALVFTAASGHSENLMRLLCPDGYTLLGPNCYLVSSDPHAGADAAHLCESKNGTVAIVDSKEEMDLLKDGFLSATVYFGINLQDLREKMIEYAFKLSGHSGYLSLKPGEPDNHGGEDCLVADAGADFNMADVSCSESHPVLCKAPAVVLPVEKQCHPDASQFDTDTCFWARSSRAYTWSQAAEACSSRGMTLASIHSQAENDFIRDMVTDNPWIGLTKEDNTFKWHDGTALDYVNWGDGEPNHGGLACINMGAGAGLWWDDGCGWVLGVVCRGPPEYVEFN